MAQKTSLIFKDAAAALPAEYELPASLDLEMTSVRARINGAGAAAAFIVVLEALAQDGTIMAQARIDQEFAVADTGALTWAPFLKRQAAAVSSSGVISYALAAVNNQAIAAGGSLINFATLDSTFDAGGHVSLTAGADLQINDAGVYAFHFLFSDYSTALNVNTTLFMSADVLSGSNGLWSSGTAGDDMSGLWAATIEADGSVEVDAYGDPSAHAYAAWATSDTFPVVVQFFVQWAEDSVGVGKTADFRVSVVRLGAGDV